VRKGAGGTRFNQNGADLGNQGNVPRLNIQASALRPFFRFQSPGAPACLFPVSLIDRHILREWLKIFSLVLGATLGLLLMQSL
jgi:hypothetical protein